MKSMIRGAALGLAVVLSAQAAHAQGLSFGVGAGAVMPTGTYGDFNSMGWNVTAVARLKPPVAPLGLQVDGFYNRFGLESGIDGHSSIIGATANAVFAFPSVSPVRPYLLGGAGVYNQKASVAGESASQTKVGLNAGAGFDFALGSAKLFADARFHAILKGSVDATTGDEATAYMIPITLGLRF
ncbi:MAG: outer membrane beta-barrel protein [Gemmatimonadales bacterium]|nr:outer membrane beta-barrel protein [Gemmatimonadales bacterium]MBA3554883.1 outer membrane beta-barrel protein [Gemmatimonadales bacterium]